MVSSILAKAYESSSLKNDTLIAKYVLAKSLICSKKISSGEIFTENNIEVKGPSKGLSPQFYYEILGKKSTRNINVGDFLQEIDLE